MARCVGRPVAAAAWPVAVSSGVDVDMNAELVAHGYSNGIAGLVGGTIWKAIGLFRISPYFNI